MIPLLEYIVDVDAETTDCQRQKTFDNIGPKSTRSVAVYKMYMQYHGVLSVIMVLDEAKILNCLSGIASYLIIGMLGCYFILMQVDGLYICFFDIV